MLCSAVCVCVLRHPCNWITVIQLFHNVTHKLISFPPLLLSLLSHPLTTLDPLPHPNPRFEEKNGSLSFARSLLSRTRIEAGNRKKERHKKDVTVAGILLLLLLHCLWFRREWQVTGLLLHCTMSKGSAKRVLFTVMNHEKGFFFKDSVINESREEQEKV